MGVSRKVQELRIHGVGGSPGEGMLGLSDPDHAMLTAEGVGTAFLARRSDRSIEGYDWGGLTSDSALQPLWVLLLPFTLVNVAGWMHPPWGRASPRRINAIVKTAHFLAACMTASWVLYLSLVFVDLIGYQWTRRLAAHEGVQGFFVDLTTSTGGVQPIQYVGMAVGSLFVLGLMWALRRIAGNTQKAFEAKTPAPGTPGLPETDAGWGPDENLFSPTFFAHPGAAGRRLTAHSVVILATFACVVAVTIWMVAREDPTLRIGRLLLLLGGIEFLGVAVLAGLTFKSYTRRDERPLRMIPAATAALGFALTNAVFSGLILFISERLKKWPALSESVAVEPILTGGELLLTDVWFVLMIAAIVMTLVWVLRHRSRGSADDVPDRTTPPGAPLDGAEPGWKQTIAQARGLAMAAERAPILLRNVIAVFFLVGLAMSIYRFQTNGSWMPLDWNLSLVELDRGGTWAFWDWKRIAIEDEKTGFFWGAGKWFLTLLPPATIGLVYAATRQKTMRRTVGILWDVLTFWPRRFHPFGVRPYSERAVVEFQARIRRHAAKGPLVVSAHSQGSIIAFPALASAEAHVKAKTALVTYGSPIRTLYGWAFPAYFGSEAVSRLRTEILPDRPGCA